LEVSKEKGETIHAFLGENVFEVRIWRKKMTIFWGKNDIITFSDLGGAKR